MIKDYLISIVVPIYNVESFLNQCLESIREQTYSNIEVILVNDGSTDGSGAICEHFSNKDARFKVIHQSNMGVSGARKTGLTATRGDYIMFLDGDDWIDKNTIEECIQTISQNESVDVILFSYMKELGKHSIEVKIFDKDQIFKGIEAKQKIHRRIFGLYGDDLSSPSRMENVVSCCMKLYKRTHALEGRFFDTSFVGSCEDGLFNVYALANIETAIYIDKPFYHYRKSGNSLTSTYRPKLQEQWNNLYLCFEKSIRNLGLSNDYYTALNNRKVLSVVGIGLNELCNPSNSIIGKIKTIKSYITEDNYQKLCKSFSIEKLPFPWKLLILCSRNQLSIILFLFLSVINILRKKI